MVTRTPAGPKKSRCNVGWDFLTPQPKKPVECKKRRQFARNGVPQADGAKQSQKTDS